ncbi:MAG: MATE family efflux transporter [Oscillospiraceae bacterium]|nr:MATE family efflux transporter [Oscillospiraceae bacterium]
MSGSEKIFSKKDLAKLIFPLMIELALTLLVGMIDSVMVSSAGEEAVSGVALIDTVFQLLIYIFAAFGTGGAVVAGQYLGAGKQSEARETSGQLVWFSGLVSLGITVLIYLLRKLLLTVVFGAITQKVYDCANAYLLISALSIPALSVYESGAAVFRTMGNSKITMYLSAMMNFINICGNAFLIYSLKLGTAGAAIATVISRYAAAVVIICLLLQKKRTLYLEKTLHYKPNGALIKKILSIGVPNGVENGLFQAGKIILVSLVTSFGTSAITANTVCQTIASIQVIPGSASSLLLPR